MREIKFKLYPLILLVIFSLTNHSFSQEGRGKMDIQLTFEKRTKIVDEISEIFSDYYPLPDVAKEMTGYINKKLKKGEYRQFTAIAEFTSQLTKDLRTISKDYHIKISPYEKIPDDLLAEIKLGSGDDNYGFQKVENLPGNIGYINLTSFNNTRSAGVTAIAAMNFVANSDALIIDLRLNGGGDESMAQFISSYFFDESTYITSYYIRKDDKTEQRWTQNWVSGPRMTDIPIYILLSSFSYSSSEVLAYALQQLGKAVIIGEKTRGGVHGVRYMSFPEISINMKVPYSQEINPYSKTNYIDGIIPDISTSADKAYIVANIEACKKILKTEKDTVKRYKLEWVLSGYEIDLKPMISNNDALSEYVGVYKNIQFILEFGKLYLQSNGGVKQELIQMDVDLFKYKEQKEEKYRMQFSRDETGKVIEFYWFDRDGDIHPPKKRINE